MSLVLTYQLDTGARWSTARAVLPIASAQERAAAIARMNDLRTVNKAILLTASIDDEPVIGGASGIIARAVTARLAPTQTPEPQKEAPTSPVTDAATNAAPPPSVALSDVIDESKIADDESKLKSVDDDLSQLLNERNSETTPPV